MGLGTCKSPCAGPSGPGGGLAAAYGRQTVSLDGNDDDGEEHVVISTFNFIHSIPCMYVCMYVWKFSLWINGCNE